MRTFSLSSSMLLAALSLFGMASAAPIDTPEARALPTPISVATAKQYLSELTVKPEANSDTYERSEFPHWITISGTCNTREMVLKRDGVNVVTSSSCVSQSGSWFSPFDKKTWTSKDDIQIDHLVPLSEAWASGASEWTRDKRREFANDLIRPELIAVTGSVNNAKGDKDPAEWLPPAADYHCTYVRAWVEVKHYYDLSVDQKEYNEIKDVLDSC